MSSKNKNITLRRRNKGIDFNLLVAGESCLGKSTFVNTLFHHHVIKRRYLVSDDEQKEQVDSKSMLYDSGMEETQVISEYKIDYKGPGDLRIKCRVVDTPGFGNRLDNTESLDAVVNYIVDKLKNHDVIGLSEGVSGGSIQPAEMTKNKRNSDERIHCCLFFLSPNDFICDFDLLAMRRISELCNVIPVIAKSDTMMRTELNHTKICLRNLINMNSIIVYDPTDDDDEDEHSVGSNNIGESFDGVPKVASPKSNESKISLEDSTSVMIPFAIIGASSPTLGTRVFPWGTVEVDNGEHSDVAYLRDLLLGSFLNVQDLVNATNDIFYERFRASQIKRVTTLRTTEPNNIMGSDSDIAVSSTSA